MIFSGTGADEIFTGYYDHFLMHLNEIKNKKEYNDELNSWSKFIKPLVRNKDLQNPYLFTTNESFRKHIYYDKKFLEIFFNKIKTNFI